MRLTSCDRYFLDVDAPEKLTPLIPTSHHKAEFAHIISCITCKCVRTRARVYACVLARVNVWVPESANVHMFLYAKLPRARACIRHVPLSVCCSIIPKLILSTSTRYCVVAD